MGIQVNNLCISKEFLQSKLGLKLLSVKVGPGTKAGDNYMSAISSVQVVTDEGETCHWIIKCYPSHPIRQEFANKTNMFYKELFIYKVWIPELQRFQVQDVRKRKALNFAFAPLVGGECIDYSQVMNGTSNGCPKVYHPLDNFIILEDLRKAGYKMADRQLGLDYPHCKLVLEELAKYHALTWAYKQFHGLDSVTSKYPILDYKMDSEDLETVMEILKASISQAVEALNDQFGFNCQLGVRLKEFEPKFGHILRVFYTDEDERSLNTLCGLSCNEDTRDELWRVLCHGDCWINNFLFLYCPSGTTSRLRPPPSRTVLVDHAVARELCPMVELAYMLYTSTSFVLRKNYIDDLLKLYHDTFLETCRFLNTQPLPDFCMKMLRRKFQRAKLYGFTIAMLALPMFLKNPCDIIDIDEMPMDVEKDYAELMQETMSNGNKKMNPIFQKRIVELVQEMQKDGIL